MPVVFWVLPDDIAWRWFFAIGILPAVLVWFIRRIVPESETFTKSRVKVRDNADFLKIFVSRQRRITITSTLLATGIFGGAYIMITWLPTYLRLVLGLPITSMSGYLAVNILGSLIGPFIYGLVSDRYGRGRTFMMFLCCQAVVVACYLFLPIGLGLTLVLGLFLGAFQGGLASGLTPTFAELYPTSIRASGAGFCTSFGRGFGAIMPAAVGIASAYIPLGYAMGGFAILSYLLGFCAACVLPDATGVDMNEVADATILPVGGADNPSELKAR